MIKTHTNPDKNLRFFKSARFVYAMLPESGTIEGKTDKTPESGSQKPPEDPSKLQEKYNQEAAKLKNTLAELAQSQDPVIQTEARKAIADLAKVETPEGLAEGQKEAVLEQIEGQIMVFNARDFAKSKDYATREGDFAIAQLNAELTGSDEKEKMAEIKEQIKKVEGAQSNATAVLELFKEPKDSGKRALILGNLKDQLTAITTGNLYESSYVNTAEKLTGELLDVTAVSLQDAEAMGGKDAPASIKDKIGKTVAIKGLPEFRLDGSGMALTKLIPGTMVDIVSPKVYEITNLKGENFSYIKVQIANGGAIGYIQVDLSEKSQVPGTKEPAQLAQENSRKNPAANIWDELKDEDETAGSHLATRAEEKYRNERFDILAPILRKKLEDKYPKDFSEYDHNVVKDVMFEEAFEQLVGSNPDLINPGKENEFVNQVLAKYEQDLNSPEGQAEMARLEAKMAKVKADDHRHYTDRLDEHNDADL